MYNNINNANQQKILEKNLTKPTRDFFDNLSNYVGEPLHFYGSVLRSDFNKKSDVDVSIFTSNTGSVISRLSSFLQINKKKIKKIIWKIAITNKVIHGYKVMYSNEEKGILTELSIYNEKNRNDVLKEHNKKLSIPSYATILLWILKFLYYDLGFITFDNYKYLKGYILTYGIGYEMDKFVAF
jgi:predicted nucleotidyltransferase